MTEAEFIAVGAIVAILGALRAAWSPCGQSMLAMLTPLGERSRGFSWRGTFAAFTIGAIGAGALGGALLGAAGSVLPGGARWREVALIVVLATATVIDGTALRRRLPLTRRQVNEDWLTRYRGWVYGFGFGAQLGLGFITLVACAAIYATFAIELLSGSVAAGAAIGAVFGASKALSLLPAGLARDPASLIGLHRRLIGFEAGAARAVVGAELLALVVVARVIG